MTNNNSKTLFSITYLLLEDIDSEEIMNNIESYESYESYYLFVIRDYINFDIDRKGYSIYDLFVCLKTEVTWHQKDFVLLQISD